VTGAFAYLIFNTSRNRLLVMARRLRSPRYAIGLVLGLAYFWLIFARRTFTQSPSSAAAVNDAYSTLAPVFILIVIAGIWIFGGDKSALAFTEAEVSMLLTAPVSRRALVSYKLARSQIIILINVVLWVFLLRRGNSALPGPLSAAAVWVMFTTLNLHRMGAALTRAARVEYRAAGKKRAWAARAFGFTATIGIIGFVVLGPLSAIRAPADDSPIAFVHGVMLLLASPGVRAVLYPFHLVVAPVFARGADQWALAMLPALGIVLLHVWWVLRSDAAFEEAAALASAEYARRIDAMRARRTMAAVPQAGAGTRTIGLASSGNPAIAIFWKNAIALRRTFQAGAIVRVLFMVVIVSVAFGWKSGDTARRIGTTALIIAALAPLLGMQVIRNDLRSDMMHLPFLKSIPLAGADLVLAEVASVAVPMVIFQLVWLAIAGVALTMSTTEIPLPAGVRIGIAVTAPLTLIALNGAICTILNGSAVLFPSWIRLGPGGPGGVELMGQTMLSTIASMVMFALLLLIPVALGTASYFALQARPVAAVTAACLVGAIALGAESYGMILTLGHAFERAEPQQVS
jgi:ABC-2 type transport system permease protein